MKFQFQVHEISSSWSFCSVQAPRTHNSGLLSVTWNEDLYFINRLYKSRLPQDVTLRHQSSDLMVAQSFISVGQIILCQLWFGAKYSKQHLESFVACPSLLAEH